MTREQQNTFIMIATILIVSLVTFIAIFNIIWGILAEPVNNTISSIGYFLRTQNIDYNFEVPTQETQTIENTNQSEAVTEVAPVEEPQTVAEQETSVENTEETIQETPNQDVEVTNDLANIEIDYNFEVPKENTNNANINFESFPDAILSDAILAGYGSGNDTPQVNLQIVIPKIGVNSPVLQGLGADDLLERGFWTYPGSYELGKGEVVMLCHRRFFGPYDPRSCWFLDKLANGDEIIMKYSDVSLKYQVVGVSVFEGDDPLIYSISDSDDYIKIVTCTPLYSNTHRLVVLAKRI